MSQANNMNEAQVKVLIQQEVAKQFSNKIVGDTPTDALQLVNKKYVDNKVLSAYVNSNGVVFYLPTGWSVNRSIPGTYIITHNLNTVNYAVVGLTDSTASFANNTGPVLWTVNAPSANAFTFLTFRYDNGTGLDCPFWLILEKK